MKDFKQLFWDYIFAVYFIIIICILVGLLATMSSCSTQHYAKQACKFHAKHIDITDSLAVKWYPITTFIKRDTVLLQGLPIFVSGDTVIKYMIEQRLDTVFTYTTNFITRHELQVDTVKIVDSIQVEDTARISWLIGKNKELTAKCTTAESNRLFWLRIALFFIGWVIMQIGYGLVHVYLSKRI